MREVPRELSETIREQWPIIVGIVTGALVAILIPEFIMPRLLRYRNDDLSSLLLNIAADLFGAVVIFLALERGIKSMNSITVIPNLPADRFIHEVRTRGRVVRLLETWTMLVTEDVYLQRFTEALGEALNNNATVQVLLIHPDSAAARQRAMQLTGSVDVIHAVRKCIRRFHALESLGSGLEVRLYNALPSITMYQCNRTAYVSLFPISQPSSGRDLLEVEMFSRFGLFIERSFDELWAGSDQSPTIPVRHHMRLRLDSVPQGDSAYFAFDAPGGDGDRRHGYMAGPHLWDHLLDAGRLRDRITFQVDEARFEARLRGPSGTEIETGRRLIQERYEWTDDDVERNLPVVVCLEDITCLEIAGDPTDS